RNVYVLFNTNATLLSAEWSHKLIDSGLDEIRCSIDGADPQTYAQIRGLPLLHKLVRNLAEFIRIQREVGASKPRASLWMTGMKENVAEIPDVLRLAARIGVSEVYVQRMVYYADPAVASTPGMMDAGHGLYDDYNVQVEDAIAEAEKLAAELGVTFKASGATTPRHSLEASRAPDPHPWQGCLRPWTTAYVTANGNVLPCCIAPFATTDYESLKMGNLFERPFVEIWNGDRYQEWRRKLLSDQPHPACAGCGVHWSL
ncbi:MAG TPA: radical SAM/SPASM domain-containing protein, partial [Aggregatilineales bacterium]|nr:radical SAM/SPASM domain-containing protein [Aggregatilineales bacterium]